MSLTLGLCPLSRTQTRAQLCRRVSILMSHTYPNTNCTLSPLSEPPQVIAGTHEPQSSPLTFPNICPAPCSMQHETQMAIEPVGTHPNICSSVAPPGWWSCASLWPHTEVGVNTFTSYLRSGVPVEVLPHIILDQDHKYYGLSWVNLLSLSRDVDLTPSR